MILEILKTISKLPLRKTNLGLKFLFEDDLKLILTPPPLK